MNYDHDGVLNFPFDEPQLSACSTRRVFHFIQCHSLVFLESGYLVKCSMFYTCIQKKQCKYVIYQLCCDSVEQILFKKKDKIQLEVSLLVHY